MVKEIIVFSDVELGSGTITDDFISENLFISVLKDISKTSNSIDLVFNGDTFDFLKTPIFINNKEVYPHHITAEIAIEKFESVYNAHKRIFDELSLFLKDEKNSLYFIIGNHDYELIFEPLQDLIKSRLNSTRIYFTMTYTKDLVYIEHGHQYHIYTKFVEDKVFREYKKKKELNIPLLFSGMLNVIISFKKKHPFIERVEDRKKAQRFVKLGQRIIVYWQFVKFFFLNSINSFLQYLTRGYTWEFFETGYSFFKDFMTDDFDVCALGIFKDAIKKIDKKYKIIVFGHRHIYSGFEYDHRKFLVLNAWRDEYDLTADNLLVPKTKNYARITYDGKDHDLEIVNYDLETFKLDVKEVVKDENKDLQYVNLFLSELDLKDYKVSKFKI